MASLRWIILGELLLCGATAAAAEHPRIFITPGDLPRLRALAGQQGSNALGFSPGATWQALRAEAEAWVAGPPYHRAVDMPGREGGPSKRWEYTFGSAAPPRHDDYSHYPPWTGMFQPGGDSITARIETLSLAYAITEDAKFADKAKRMVLDLCAWPGPWTDPSYGGGKPCLDTGHAAAAVAIFYDWCYPALTPADRDAVRSGLVEKALAPIDAYLDRLSAYHNGHAILTTGLCLGGIALLGDDARAKAWVDHAAARATLYFDAQGRDGGAMEGPNYGTYAADSLADAIWAISSAGIPSALVEHNFLKTLPRYCIALANPNTFEQPCFGDGGPTRGFGQLMLTLALRGDTDAAWYCQRSGQFAGTSLRRFLALDPQRLRPRQPAFNPSACFIDVGYAVLRDGYQPGSAFLAFKCGPPAAVIGHNHFDHNSFVINYQGAWVAWDPGYRSYFNPPERRYSTSTLGHNSVVLDLDAAYLAKTAESVPGHDQTRLDKGRIREFFTSPGFDYVLGDAAQAYNGPAQSVLDRFDRQIVFAKPDVFFIRDRLAAPREHTYSFLLHLPPQGRFEIEGPRVRAFSQSCRLDVGIFSPRGLGMCAASYAGAEDRGPYLAATTRKAKAATILCVLVPRRHDCLLVNPGFEKGMNGWTPAAVRQNHVIDTVEKHGGSASGRIDRGGYYYTEHFTLPVGTRVTARWWAKTTAAGASVCLYYWKQGKAFAYKYGPAAAGPQWRQYEVSDVVPPETEDVCLAMNYFGKGQCWYDDVEISVDPALAHSRPAEVRALGPAGDGAMALVDGVSYYCVCREHGSGRKIRAAAGHSLETDAELAVVRVGSEGPTAFLVRGTRIRWDGQPITVVSGQWLKKAETE